jgi:hypothetical protein
VNRSLLARARRDRLQALVAAAALASGACTMPAFGGDGAAASKAVSETSSAAAHVVAHLDVAEEAAPETAAAASRPVPVPVRRPARAANRTAPRSAATAMPLEIVPAEPEVVPVVEPARPERAQPEAARAPVAAAAVPARRDSLAIYSDEDPDVTPARLLTTQTGGPLFSGAQPEMNTMELIVSPQGRVEQVRLISPPRRMTDMLLLSGAKTWKFTPAMKEGVPVRYRTTISWEITP